mmetsp:Transcript_26242/g.43851  ORF Transcript_26242/g.43851 Transcript_26242/m.43851 type:complete len:136 (+) Transcript_26242:1-408(+)
MAAFIFSAPAVPSSRAVVAARSSSCNVNDARRAMMFGAEIAMRASPSAGMSAQQFFCEASKKFDVAKTVSAGVASFLAVMPPTFAADLIDQPLLGEGTGLPLGINDNTIFFLMLGIFSVVFILYLSWARDQPDLE